MAQSIRARAMATRYSEAYLVARGTNGAGKTIQVIGILLGALLVLVSFVAVVSDKREFLQLGAGGIGFGCFIGTLLYVFGVLISAQGEILKAGLDSAVNSSPFLTDDERADIMSLPKESTTAAGGPHALDDLHF